MRSSGHSLSPHLVALAPLHTSCRCCSVLPGFTVGSRHPTSRGAGVSSGAMLPHLGKARIAPSIFLGNVASGPQRQFRWTISSLLPSYPSNPISSWDLRGRGELLLLVLLRSSLDSSWASPPRVSRPGPLTWSRARSRLLNPPFCAPLDGASFPVSSCWLSYALPGFLAGSHHSNRILHLDARLDSAVLGTHSSEAL
ncbi:hypothetical protein NDU88_005306 [Pleurodeles waltl]|uniref:Secreted protein n=1 Tax=Pleurodeles waltl TaxID=8319 RepID=A0AAV7MYW3_PLEWA|nr:hypothetical protein NDU88_005306 [Pleurodeles waltl]